MVGALDIMRSADAEPNGSRAFKGHDCYRLDRVADRSADHDRHFFIATLRSGLHRLARHRAPISVEGTFMLPGRPDNSREAIG